MRFDYNGRNLANGRDRVRFKNAIYKDFQQNDLLNYIASLLYIRSVCPTAIKMTLPAFAAERRAAAPLPSPTCRTAFPAQHLRPSGVLGCWPDGLELTPGFYPRSNEQHRLF